jgi:hypothetical protein
MYRIIGADGREYGPVSAEQLRQWMAEGRVNQQTRVLMEGATEWKRAADFPELTASASPPPLHPTPQPSTIGSVPNYLMPAILVTVCCCLPFGIPAIVYAAQVNSKLSGGDVAGAQEASQKAKMWCWIAFGLGLASNVIAGIIYGLQALAMAHHGLR